jgi:dihydrofolate reductase/thymidylate synthase
MSTSIIPVAKSPKFNFGLNLVVAVDKNYGFAKNNTIPWHHSPDLKFFAKLTKETVDPAKSNVVIMGRKTWDCMPAVVKPLKNRSNIVVSRSLKSDETKDNYYTADSIESAVKHALKLVINNKAEKIFLIGGLDLFEYGLKSVLLDKVYLTRINKDYECDRLFPKELLLNKTWHKLEDQTEVIDKNTQLDFMTFVSKKDHIDENQYLALIKDILENGHMRQTRNDTTFSKFGNKNNMIFDLKDSFPLFTTKKMFLRGIFLELKMFLMGKTDTIKYLSNYGVKIWEGNTTTEFHKQVGLSHLEAGDLGSAYGFQLRHFAGEYKGMNANYENIGFDQLSYLIDTICKDKYSRRLLMTVYNPGAAKNGVLFPCTGIIYQFYVSENNELDMFTYIRSSDQISGYPWNVGFFALFIKVMVELINNSKKYNGEKLVAGRLIVSYGDTHIYNRPDHVDAVLTHLSRLPISFPKVTIQNNRSSIEDIEWSDIKIDEYQSYPAIKATMIA